jgi:hypothetical protein
LGKLVKVTLFQRIMKPGILIFFMKDSRLRASPRHGGEILFYPV